MIARLATDAPILPCAMDSRVWLLMPVVPIHSNATHDALQFSRSVLLLHDYAAL